MRADASNVNNRFVKKKLRTKNPKNDAAAPRISWCSFQYYANIKIVNTNTKYKLNTVIESYN